MDLAKNLNELHRIISSDEKMMRLLFYIAENKDDDVLIVSDVRPNIINNREFINAGLYEAGSVLYDDIIRDRIILSSNADNLDSNNPTCQINLYIDALEKVNGLNGAINHTLLNLNLTIDIYVHREYDTIDARLYKILSRLYDLLYYKSVVGMGKFIMESSLPISDKEETFDGFVGYRSKFRTSINAPV